MTFLDNMYAIVGIVVVGFVVVAYVGYSVADAVWLQKSRIRRRVDELGDGKDKQEPESPEPAVAPDDPLPTIAKFITTRGFTDRLLLMLVRAGIKLRPSEFVGIVCGIALLLALIGAVLFKSIAVEVLAIAIGILGPYAYVKSLQVAEAGYVQSTASGCAVSYRFRDSQRL
jgi:Flp pilus assembly protein TadB